MKWFMLLLALTVTYCAQITITGDGNHITVMQSNSGSLNIPVSALPGIP